eukprot:7870486-Heterocapsa_arctica.AAC.1
MGTIRPRPGRRRRSRTRRKRRGSSKDKTGPHGEHIFADRKGEVGNAPLLQILYHVPGMEETGQDADQDQEEDQSGKVEDNLSPEEVDPESGEEYSRGDLSENHTP